MRSREEKLFDRQTAIMEWLLALGHEVEDKYLFPDAPVDGLTRYLGRPKEVVKIGGTTIVFDD